MRTTLILLGVGAAIAGLVYCLRDNEEVKNFIETAKDSASGAADSMKETFTKTSLSADVMLDQWAETLSVVSNEKH